MQQAGLGVCESEVLSAVLEPMKHDLGLTDTQAGMLQSFFFLSMAILTFPAAYMVDRWSRRKMVYRGKMLFYQKNYDPLRTGLLRLMFGGLSLVKMLPWSAAYILPRWRERSQRELKSNAEVIQLCWRLE